MDAEKRHRTAPGGFHLDGPLKTPLRPHPGQAILTGNTSVYIGTSEPQDGHLAILTGAPGGGRGTSSSFRAEGPTALGL